MVKRMRFFFFFWFSFCTFWILFRAFDIFFVTLAWLIRTGFIV